MEILIVRKYKKNDYSIGQLSVNGNYFCDTIEDTDRGLTQDMPLEKIKKLKVQSKTAIPTGTYNVNMDIVSPKYSKKDWYAINCKGGKLPRLENVPGFEGILIHPGNTAEDSEGCILVGKNTSVGALSQSRDYFLKLYKLLCEANNRKEKIMVRIE